MSAQRDCSAEAVEAGALGMWAGAPADIIERVCKHLSHRQRCTCHLVNRHWCEVLRGSKTLWASTELGGWDAGAAGSVLAWCSTHAAGIQDLSLAVEEGQWCDAAAVLGKLDRSLQRLVLAAPGDCPLECSQSFLWALHGLTYLDVENALETIGPEVGRLSQLRELLVSREDGPGPKFEVPDSISRLQSLTRLELVHCVETWPAQLSSLTRLHLLNLEGNDFSACRHEIDACLARLTLLEELDLAACCLSAVPASLSRLTNLTTLCLDSAFSNLSLSAQEWDAALACVLGPLSRCVFLDLSENGLAALPAPVAAMTQLETLKLEHNPLADDGLLDGPYLDRLFTLDLKGSCLSVLPPHLARATGLQFLGLCCCHDLQLDRPTVESVLGRLPQLTGLSLCGQMLQSVDAAKALLTLGRLNPNLEILSQEEVDAHGSDEGEGEGWLRAAATRRGAARGSPARRRRRRRRRLRVTF